MESLSRLSVLATYVVMGCAVGIAAWLGGIYYGSSAPNIDSESVSGEDGGSNDAISRSRHEPGRGVPVDYLIAQQAQIESLQKLLGDKERLLEKKNQLLEEKTLKQLSLEGELTEAIGMLEMLAADFSLRSDQPADAEDGGLSAELSRLRNERNVGFELAKGLQDDLDQLKLELATTDEQIRELQQQSELEATVLLAEMQTFQSVASDALADLGEQAVPSLVNLLSDSRPRIRQWAARVLGDIGPPAREAVPALVNAMRDESPEVQRLVRDALEQIQPTD